MRDCFATGVQMISAVCIAGTNDLEPSKPGEGATAAAILPLKLLFRQIYPQIAQILRAT
jgi:hypothetical protein